MSNNAPTNTPLLEFGGFTVPAGCRRIFITAELEPSNGDPRIQPTGFPDIGPVLYPDPSGRHGLICLIESEASMANRLEEVCLADKYTGTLKPVLNGLPYIKLTDNGLPDGQLVTTSTIDGHRFASEYIMSGLGKPNPTMPMTFTSFDPTLKPPATPKSKKKEEAKSTGSAKPEFVSFVRDYLGMTGTDKCPAANIPNIFVLAMEYDPLSLIHGFQISVKKKLTFVGLRSPRALTASIVGLDCERIVVPGVRIDPIGSAAARQAIFQKQRVSAKKVEARFAVDVGLLSSLRLDGPAQDGKPGQRQDSRVKLLLAIALWKVGTFLELLRVEFGLRTECKLRLKKGQEPKYQIDNGSEATFPCEAIAKLSLADNSVITIRDSRFQDGHSPLILKFEKSKDGDNMDNNEADSQADNIEQAE